MEYVEVTHPALSKERGEKVVVTVTANQAKHMAASGWKPVKPTNKVSDDGES